MILGTSKDTNVRSRDFASTTWKSDYPEEVQGDHMVRDHSVV